MPVVRWLVKTYTYTVWVNDMEYQQRRQTKSDPILQYFHEGKWKDVPIIEVEDVRS